MITAQQAKRLREAGDDDELREVVDEIEEEWDGAFETDKAWDALHRCFSNGTLDPEEGDAPLNLVFFGGRVLNEDDTDVVVLLTPTEVKEVAAALRGVTEAWLRKRYFDLPFPDYQTEKSEEDWRYTIGQFAGLPEFFAQAAGARRHVIFTVSQ